MSSVREQYLDSAGIAARLLATPQVAAAWEEKSALAKMSVKGLAGHLAGQIFFIPKILAEPIPSEPMITIGEYYARVAWIGSDIDDEFNTLIRTSGERDAAAGPAALAEAVAACVRDLRRTLPGTPTRPVRRPTWGAWSIGLDEFVASRMLEVLVHCDDLAHSVGLSTPQFPAEATETVVDLLSRIALRRHGQSAVLRTLSRAERAPASIAAI